MRKPIATSSRIDASGLKILKWIETVSFLGLGLPGKRESEHCTSQHFWVSDECQRNEINITTFLRHSEESKTTSRITDTNDYKCFLQKGRKRLKRQALQTISKSLATMAKLPRALAELVCRSLPRSFPRTNAGPAFCSHEIIRKVGHLVQQ